MANLNLKHAQRSDRANVEKYVKNSLEYQNPHLRGPSSKFPPMTQGEKVQLTNLRVFEKLLRTFSHPDIVIAGYKLIKGRQGFFEYRIKEVGKINWEVPEVRVEFTTFEEVVDTLATLVYTLYDKQGHIQVWTSHGIPPELFPTIAPKKIRHPDEANRVKVGEIVIHSYWLKGELFTLVKLYGDEESDTE